MEILVDRYTENDFRDFKEMVLQLYSEDPTGMQMTEHKIMKTANESILHPEKVQIVILRNKNMCIGYSILTYSWSNEYCGDVLNIDELYIKNEYRSKHAASNFLRYIRESYRNVVLFMLETTPENEKALRVFRRSGFEVSANTHLIYSIDKQNG